MRRKARAYYGFLLLAPRLRAYYGFRRFYPILKAHRVKAGKGSRLPREAFQSFHPVLPRSHASALSPTKYRLRGLDYANRASILRVSHSRRRAALARAPSDQVQRAAHRATKPARLRALRYREHAHVQSRAKRKRVRNNHYFAFAIAFARVGPLATRHSRSAKHPSRWWRLDFPRSRRTRAHQTRLQERSFMSLLHVCYAPARVRSRCASQTDCGARGCVWCVSARGPSCVKTLASVTRA
jgi:hypothetical protein